MMLDDLETLEFSDADSIAIDEICHEERIGRGRSKSGVEVLIVPLLSAHVLHSLLNSQGFIASLRRATQDFDAAKGLVLLSHVRPTLADVDTEAGGSTTNRELYDILNSESFLHSLEKAAGDFKLGNGTVLSAGQRPTK